MTADGLGLELASTSEDDEDLEAGRFVLLAACPVCGRPLELAGIDRPGSAVLRLELTCPTDGPYRLTSTLTLRPGSLDDVVLPREPAR